MLDVGFSEILLTSAIALIVLGPERLPKVARQVGNWMGRARAMARQLSEQLEREVSAEELLKTQSKPTTGTNSSRNVMLPNKGTSPNNSISSNYPYTPSNADALHDTGPLHDADPPASRASFDPAYTPSILPPPPLAPHPTSAAAMHAADSPLAAVAPLPAAAPLAAAAPPPASTPETPENKSSS
jgi:Tat protein translocase TatB subunit